jgi:hypothetical protein
MAARDNVLAGAALSLNQHWDIGCGQFDQTLLDGLHGLGTTKSYCLGRDLSEGLG